MMIILHILVNLAFCAVGFYLGNRQNKARMTKLASSNIDLINTVAELSEYKNNVSVVEHYAIKKENESLKFQIQQFNIAKDQMKFTDQG